MPETRFRALDAGAYALPPGVGARTLTPALVVDLDRVHENVRRVLVHTGGPERWRPHLKTTKTPEIWAELLRAGVRQFKCATVREARVLSELVRAEGVTGADLLVAYPLLGPALDALGALADEYPEMRLSVLSEDPEIVARISPRLSVFVDVNPGMNRTGLPLARSAEIVAVARAAGDRFRGVHFYEGHLHAGDPTERRAAVFACHDQLLELYRELVESERITVGELVTSGTPGFLAALAYPAWSQLTGTRHRVSPGTVVLHDLRSEQENADLDLVPAATVLARVVSHPAHDVVTCDAGSKSIAAEAGDPCAFVLGRPELEALAPSEEHLPLRVTEGEPPARGTLLQLVPRHVCPTVNLAEELVLVEGGEARRVAVPARAHDLWN